MWLVLLLLVGATAAQADDGVAGLDAEVQQYESGEYAAAASGLEALIAQGQLTAPNEERARTYAAAAQFALGNQERAREHLVALVKLSPAVTVDPEIFPSRFVALLEEVRREVRPQLLPSILEPPPARESAPLHYAFIPFGVGQFANQAPYKGAFFLGAEALAFTTAAVAFAAFEANKLPGSPGPFACSTATPCRFDDPAQAQALQTTYVAAFWTGTAVAVAGIVEALLDR